jgi:serine protease
MYRHINTGFFLFLVMLVGCAEEGSKSSATQGGSKTGSYIVVLKKSQKFRVASTQRQAFEARAVVVSALDRLSLDYNLPKAKRVYSAVLEGGAYQLTTEEASRLASDPNVELVEPDHRIKINATQANAPWGLDRLDQSTLPLNGQFSSPTPGANVNVYIIDSGVRVSHQDFQGRAVSGVDLVDGDGNANDCNGHGTHVAGTVAGLTFGVAKSARIHAVRVLDCEGAGQYSDVIAGVEWVTTNHTAPAVANMSLGGPISQALESAIAASVSAGVTFVVAAGNSTMDACSVSPARVPSVITVGSTTRQDARSPFSNYGSCVDIFAPGTDIFSAGITSNTATDTMSGTSMAAPHVAGAVALYLSVHPQATPAEVSSALTSGSITGRITDARSGSPNRLLNIAFLGTGEAPPVTPPVVPPPVTPPVEPPTTPPSVDEGSLSNGVPVTGLSGAAGLEKRFQITIPGGVENLLVETTGGSGDLDLYVKRNQEPTETSYDCRPYSSGNNEECRFANPAAGTFYILIRGYSQFSGANLKVTYQLAAPPVEPPPVVAPCTDCELSEGRLERKGTSNFHPAPSYFAKSGRQRFWLQGPDNADFDIHLLRLNEARQWVKVASSTKTKSVESISYDGKAGTYQFYVESYSGSGAYRLWSQIPR